MNDRRKQRDCRRGGSAPEDEDEDDHDHDHEDDSVYKTFIAGFVAQYYTRALDGCTRKLVLKSKTTHL